jgi:hypothetical protein
MSKIFKKNNALARVISTQLIFLFVSTPISQIFAQEIPSENSEVITTDSVVSTPEPIPGNTYTKIAEAVNASGDHAALFYAKNVTGGSSFTVSTGIVDRTLAVHEYSGVSTTTTLDKYAYANGTSAVPSSGSITTTTGNELYFGVAWSGQDGDSWTAGYNYTKRESETNNATAERIATEDAIL